MNENYEFEISGRHFDIHEELTKVEVPMEDEIIEFFFQTREDDLKKKALEKYIASIITESTDPKIPFEKFDYYDLLAIYEELEESNCED